MAPSTVRRATALDAATIAELQLQVWQQAFSDVLPSEVVLADPTAHAASWEARLSRGGAVLLATEGSEPVGFAAVAAAPDDEMAGEIELIYVVPRWGRRGHGGRLLAAAAAELRRVGATEMIHEVRGLCKPATYGSTLTRNRMTRSPASPPPRSSNGTRRVLVMPYRPTSTK